MKQASSISSTCRYCRYYNSEGRRGGLCQKLAVPVQSSWNACSLAASPFSTKWEVEEIQILLLETSFSLELSASSSTVEKTSFENLTVNQNLLPHSK